MKETKIKDFYGRVIGYIKEYPNGDKKVYDFYRRLLGTYVKSLNVTKDFYGRVIGRGDILTSLIKYEK